MVLGCAFGCRPIPHERRRAPRSAEVERRSPPGSATEESIALVLRPLLAVRKEGTVVGRSCEALRPRRGRMFEATQKPSPNDPLFTIPKTGTSALAAKRATSVPSRRMVVVARKAK